MQINKYTAFPDSVEAKNSTLYLIVFFSFYNSYVIVVKIRLVVCRLISQPLESLTYRHRFSTIQKGWHKSNLCLQSHRPLSSGLGIAKLRITTLLTLKFVDINFFKSHAQDQYLRFLVLISPQCSRKRAFKPVLQSERVIDMNTNHLPNT